MALACTLKETASKTGNWGGSAGPSYAFTAFTPAANSMLIAEIGANDDAHTDLMGNAGCVMTGGSLTWTKLTYADSASSFVARSAIFYAIVGGSPVSTTPTFTVHGSGYAGQVSGSIWECTGYDTGTPLGGKIALAKQATDGAVTMTLDAAPASTSIVLRHIHRNCDPPTGTYGVTQGNSFTADTTSDLNASFVWSQSSHRTGSTSTAVGFSDVQSGTESAKNYETAMCAVEVKAAASAGTTATPGVLALTTSTFAPKANLQLNGASPTALSTTGLAPQANLRINGASPTALTLSTFAPTVGLGPFTATPDVLALTLSTFAPTIGVSVIVTPGVLSLSLAPFAPQANLTINGASPTALSVTGLAPQSNLAINGASPTALSLSTFAPTVGLGPLTVTPDVTALTLSTFAPSVSAGGNVTVTPGVLALSLSTFAPQLKETLTPALVALTLATLTPVLGLNVPVALATLSLTGLAPGLALTVIPGPVALVTATFAPTVGAPQTVTPGVLALALTVYVPVITNSGVVLTPISIPLVGSLTPIAMTGSGLATMTGSYGLDSLTGSVGD